MAEHTAYIGLGANLGNPAQQVLSAIERLAALPGTRLAGQSGLYRTAPVEACGDDYINAVVRLCTALSPETLLDRLQEIENDFGRQRPFRNAPRTLDLDLLLYGSLQMQTPRLTLPHPGMAERAFVLVPLLEIAPEITIPGKGDAKTCLNAVSHQPVARLTA
ncbi:MAG: 2-amino-4-hydroxy-6-hydroxymethyldihydropteridine diphosphokinase [Alistipes senegalensis]|nr:2-amino-4-hydroxy-6-hydroxymethyldihydropteridine diphosphokinase [Oxalobacter formigenes]MCM1280701.1 2-amino-4-hydroxy-6-hydroxymethyldihydropteridine diphosphokinase [Alistipes senegalensis]